MNNFKRKLLVEQLDKKMQEFKVFGEVHVPSSGWVNAIRTTLNMSLAQLGKRLRKTPVTVKEMEEREQKKTITLRKLIEIAEALDLRFVYGFIPKESSLEAMIERRAQKVAREIVMRTSHTMALEDQENRKERLERSINERAENLKRDLPKYLWD